MAAESGLQLADIQEPVLSTFWPPAPIWWCIALLLMVLIVIAVRYWVQHQQRQQPLRQARSEWAGLSKEQSAELNQLLKRLLRHYQPAHAALSGSVQDWQLFLQSLGATDLPDLATLLYQPAPAQALQQQFYQAAGTLLQQLTVKQLEQLCSN